MTAGAMDLDALEKQVRLCTDDAGNVRAGWPKHIIDLIARVRELEAENARVMACNDQGDKHVIRLNARILGLEDAMKRQAAAALMGMDAAKSASTIQTQLAEEARRASSPEVLASERQANAILTEENERLAAKVATLEAERDALHKDKSRLDSGVIMTHDRDEFGDEYRCERRGLDLRAMIDAAIAAKEPRE